MMPKKAVKRIRRVKKARPLWKRRGVWWAFFVLAIFGILAWAVLFHPALQIRSVLVEGASRAPASQIKELAEEMTLRRSAGSPSRSLVLADTKRIQKEILARFPVLRDAEISKILKTGTLRIAVRERGEVARWCGEESCLAVDAEGIAFAPPLNENLNEDLIAIFNGEEPELRGRVLDPEAFSRAREFWTRMNAALGDSERVDSLRLVPATMAVFHSSGNWNAYANLTESVSWQIEKLEIVLQERGTGDKLKGGDMLKGLEYIDVRFGDQAYLKFRE